MRKLFQITGIVPLGTFFLVHLFTNSKAMNGKKVFNEAVADLHHTPYLLFIEIFGIFLPLAFHSIYGIFISAEARPNVFLYGYGRNWFYFFQRITGGFLFLFLLFHILNLRFGLMPGLNLTPVAGNADQAFDIVSREFSIPWVMVVYMLGIAATAWHLDCSASAQTPQSPLFARADFCRKCFAKKPKATKPSKRAAKHGDSKSIKN